MRGVATPLSDIRTTGDMTMDIVNYYEVLGVPKNAKKGEIRKAFRKVEKAVESESEMVLDTEEWGRAERRLLTARQAMETLLDPRRRREHDKLIDRMGSEEPDDEPGEKLFYFCFNCSQAFASPVIDRASVSDCPSCGAQNLLNPPVKEEAPHTPPKAHPVPPQPDAPHTMVQHTPLSKGYDPWPSSIKGELKNEPLTIDIEAEERPKKPKRRAPGVRPLMGEKPPGADLKSVYKEALRRALKDGVITEDEEYILEGLRSMLGITEMEHETFTRGLGFAPGRKTKGGPPGEREEDKRAESVTDID